MNLQRRCLNCGFARGDHFDHLHHFTLRSSDGLCPLALVSCVDSRVALLIERLDD